MGRRRATRSSCLVNEYSRLNSSRRCHVLLTQTFHLNAEDGMGKFVGVARLVRAPGGHRYFAGGVVKMFGCFEFECDDWLALVEADFIEAV